MSDDPLIGRRLANFRIERVLGRGGMAQVYYGQDIKLQRPVAIKVIDARYRSKPSYAQRFVKEARAVAGWRHENIIQIYYADDEDGLYYYVMEYIDGQDLANLLSTYAAEGKLMPPDDVLRVARSLAGALDYAHRHGVIHRDVKPSNVLVSKEGRVILGDFGLALDMQEGSSGEVFGTPHYISPEQARRSADVVPESDLYSLGVILFEMLTGVVPFDDESPTSVALQHITQPPPLPRSINPQLNLETQAVLLKALNKTPGERYHSGAALVSALEKALKKLDTSDQKRILPLPPMPATVLSGQTRTVAQGSSKPTAPAPEPVAPPPAPQSASKGRRPIGCLVIGVLICAAALAYAFWGGPIHPAALPLLLGRTATASATPSPDVPTATPTPSATTPPTETASPMPTATFTSTPTSTPTLPPSQTPTPTASPSQTASATLSPTSSVTATATSLPHPSATLRPSGTSLPSGTPLPVTPPKGTPTLVAALSASPSPTVTTTPQYPNWKRIWFFYNPYGFYVYNASDANRSISPLSLERLDDSGNSLNRFDGWRWADFFPTLYSNWCMRIEITQSPTYMRPDLCTNRYLSTRTLASDSDLIFWTPQANSHEFRVLWEGQEVGRCQISANSCEVFIP